MKRVTFIILWAVAFFIAITIVGSIVLPVLCKAEGWNYPMMPMSVSMVWSVISIIAPLVALGLGSRGVLPGTKKSQSKEKASK
jgi:hypothetical protein